MWPWIVYVARAVAAVVVGGLSATMLVTAPFNAGSRVAMFAIAGVFAIAAACTWPRRPNAWRRDPPTERQLAYARSLGIVVPDGSSKGEVSEMISAVTGR